MEWILLDNTFFFFFFFWGANRPTDVLMRGNLIFYVYAVNWSANWHVNKPERAFYARGVEKCDPRAPLELLFLVFNAYICIF